VYAIISTFFMLLLISMFGCSSSQAQPTTTPMPVFKYDLRGTVNGTSFDGVGVIPYSSVYTFRVESRVDVDLLSITSCHRDFSVESAINVGWFKSKRGYEYKFVPSEGIENIGSCLVRLAALNKSDGLNAWGIVDFETPGETLPATSYCNGRQDKTGGVSICQTRAGLTQRLVFEVPVKTSSYSAKCSMKSVDAKTWEYELSAGECVIAFQEIGGAKRIHRHTTVAFTDILVRGAQ